MISLRLFLSSLQGRKVYEAKGDKVATLVDLTIPLGQHSREVKGVVLRTHEGLRCARAQRLVIGNEGIICEQPFETWEVFDESSPDVIRLIDDVMDKQVIDIENRKIIRVNDVELDYTPGRILIMSVCVGANSFLRRLGGERLVRLSRSIFRSSDKWIDWNLVQPLGSAASSLRLTVPWNKAATLHPADLADIVEDLDAHEQVAILTTLDPGKAADTLALIEEDEIATSILRRIAVDRAADMIEEMSPDDAADLLAELPKSDAEAILGQMDQPVRQSVSRLMAYNERTAGGIMTTEYVALPGDITVDDAIQRIRAVAREVETIYYAYVIDKENRLTGVFSLKDLIISQPSQKLENIMTTPVIHVLLETPDSEVVDIMAKYDLSALPVTDEHKHLVGIITIDDVIDIVIERGGWRRQIRGRRR